VVVSAVLVACAVTPSPGPPDGPGATSPAGLIRGQILKVDDGDTFIFETGAGEVTVRLLGVNAPERDECLYAEAAAWLQANLEEQPVVFEDHGPDQFGRNLGYVWAGDSFVNLALVESGLAIATTPGEREIRGGDLLSAEETAYREGFGIWGPAACGATREIELTVDTSGHNPPGPDDEVLDLEHVTIVNHGATTGDLSGWLLRDESSSHRFRFPEGTIIEPGTALMVTSGDAGWEPGDSPVWNNDGDMALLLTPDGAVAARERYRP